MDILEYLNYLLEKKLFSLEKHHDVVRCIKFNYNYMMMVTSDKNLLMWIPTDTEEIYEKL